MSFLHLLIIFSHNSVHSPFVPTIITLITAADINKHLVYMIYSSHLTLVTINKEGGGVILIIKMM